MRRSQRESKLLGIGMVRTLPGLRVKPEAYISGAAKLFDQGRNLTNDSTRQFLMTFTGVRGVSELILGRRQRARAQ